MADKYWVGSVDTDYSVAGNWSPSGVPVASDDVYITNGAVDINLGLDQSAVVLSSFHVSDSYVGTIGTEDDYLQIASSVVEIGENFDGRTGVGSSRIRIDLGSGTAAQVNVTNTGTPDGQSSLDLIAGNASTDLNVIAGSVSLGADLSSVTVGDINVHGGTVLISSDVTMTKLNQSAGDIQCFSDLPDLDQSGGTLLLLDGATAITTAKLTGTAELNLQTSGSLTVTSIDVIAGKLNALTMKEVTFTALKVAPGAQVSLDFRFVTLTNDIELLTNQASKRFKLLFG